MILKNYIIYKIVKKLIGSLKVSLNIVRGLQLFLLMFFFTSCSDFVDVDLPKDRIVAESVFEDVSTATATLRNIYSKMRDAGGLESGLSINIGLYTDELDSFQGANSIYDHTISAVDGTVFGWWSNAYNLIYEANALIEGVENSASLSLEDQNQLIGEALFIRAYLHTILVELFGSIPYVITTDYVLNTSVHRMSVVDVYAHIKRDLILSSTLLDQDISGERVRPYQSVAEALLSRVYLYTEDWEAAESMASRLIDTFILEPNLNMVFLKNSSGSIWQYKPFANGQSTLEANSFILSSSPSSVALSASVISAFELGDLRASGWIGSTTVGTDTWYYAYKYKAVQDVATSISLEYSIIFRLAEQYLIRSEARAQLGDIVGAQSDLNIIRTRAGLPNITAITTTDLLDAILKERQVELFTERGHRWFDLKRTGKAAEVLAPIKLGWRETDILLPIPESEILLNPNLLPQNDGY